MRTTLSSWQSLKQDPADQQGQEPKEACPPAASPRWAHQGLSSQVQSLVPQLPVPTCPLRSLQSCIPRWPSVASPLRHRLGKAGVGGVRLVWKDVPCDCTQWAWHKGQQRHIPGPSQGQSWPKDRLGHLARGWSAWEADYSLWTVTFPTKGAGRTEDTAQASLGP